MPLIRYRLALDLGPTSLGWAVVRLDTHAHPRAVIRAGVRVFSDGRNPKDGASLAVTRRNARAMRRRRDRLLKRKQRLIRLLIEHGFFPADEAARKQLERMDPYRLRAEGLKRRLTPAEFARALFHINQRRGFKSNRRTDKKDNEAGALKTAISKMRADLAAGHCHTVGEWLHKRHQAGHTVRARFREARSVRDDGKTRIDKSYDFYIDRAMVEAEFDALWATQASFDAARFTERARADLKDALLYQRRLRPVMPGRCTLLPDEERAPLALPSTQRFRIYQEVNNLRVIRPGLTEEPLGLVQRDAVVEALERHGKCSFTHFRKLLGLPGTACFNIEDPRRAELKGNMTSAILSRRECFGPRWFGFDAELQDRIVLALLTEENESRLVAWLEQATGVEELAAERIANASLPEGYGSLSRAALARILPEVQRAVITYDKAVVAAGFAHHSNIAHSASGEILDALPYYGQYLQRHVGFGTGDPGDPPEKRFGRIANPTVHIGLNQIRIVVNALIRRYGHPAEVIVEVARELKQSRAERLEESQRQARNQDRNRRLREQAAHVLDIAPERVHRADIEKLVLWEELSHDVADRRCPYSGVQISERMVLSDEVEIEHILPFSMTLDDSMNNKTVAMRASNRVKRNRTPWDARDDFARQGWSFDAILQRALQMPRLKRYRFAEDGYAKWLKEDKDFLARALNDTRHLSRVAREYLSLVCPAGTRVIPGRMTAMLRGRFGLNSVLGLAGEKNRNDHRHHAVDACVIAVTDQYMLQAFAKASASAREKQLDRLVEDMPLPWPTYREHVERAVRNIWVSHKPDHGHEGPMMDETTYRPPHLDASGLWRTRGIGGDKPNARGPTTPMIGISEPDSRRHTVAKDGASIPYKGYLANSNYGIEITRADDGKWIGDVISTFAAYRLAVNSQGGGLRNRVTGRNGQPLVMRLVQNDCIAIEIEGRRRLMRVVKMRGGRNQVTLAEIHQGNVDARLKINPREPGLLYLQDQSANSLHGLRARQVSVSPIGEIRDPGFKG